MRFIGYFVVAFCLGLYCFFRGFRFLLRYRVLADTPLTPIRGVAMGFVEVAGTARGNETVASPVTHTPCYFYKVKIDRWQSSRNGGNWVPFTSDGDGVRFYLEDETGRVLVDAQDAELDLQDPCKTEVTREFLPLSDDSSLPSFMPPSPGAAMPPSQEALMPPTQDAILDYIDLVSSGSRTAAFQGSDPSLQYRVNPPRKKPQPRSTGGALDVLRIPGRGYAGSPHRFRLTEFCIVPDKGYTVTGTCVENPRPHDEQDRNLIVKGENEVTFLVSDESRADLQNTLGWQTARYILGGAVLTVASAALTLQSIGWLQSDFLEQLVR
jgi:hypothetical protein